MSRLTSQLTITIGGLRGPTGTVTADLTALEANVVTKSAAADMAVTNAQAAAGQAAAAVVTIGISSQTAIDVAASEQDGNGRMWSQILADGSYRFNAILDRSGNRIDKIALSNRSRVQDLEYINASDVPANVKRARRGYYDAPRLVQVQAPSSFISITTNDNGDVDLLANGITYDMRDPRIRRLGGPWTVAGTVTPNTKMLTQRNVTYLAANGPVGGNPEIVVRLPAGGTQIEWKGSGCAYVGVVIDGKLTQLMGEAPSTTVAGGGYRTHLLTLSASATARNVRLILPINASVGIVRTGSTGLLDPFVPRKLSVYCLGDSITEAVAMLARGKITGWFPRLCQALGLDWAANGGVGGRGWAKSISTGENALSAINDILTNVNGGPPDVLICALGINDPAATQADLDAITANIVAIMTAIRAVAPHMIVICLGPFGSYSGWNNQGAKQAAIFAAMKQFPHTYTIDMAPLWSDPAVYQPWYNQAMDPTHPMEAGHMAIMTYLLPLILAILKDA